VRDNVVATDYLTIRNAAFIKISTSRADSVTGWLFAVDRSRLMALIHPDGTKAPPLLPDETLYIQSGQRAFGVSSSQSGGASIVPVTVSLPAAKMGDGYFVVDSGGLELLPGSPVIDAAGRIAGMIATVRNAGSGLSYAVPARKISALIHQTVNDVADGSQQSFPGPTEPKSDAPEPASDSSVARIGDAGVTAGRVIRRVNPTYPAVAKAAGTNGTVAVEITVDESGYVIRARPLRPPSLLPGDQRFLDLLNSAAAAAMGWLFTPSTRNGVPVKLVSTITFSFELGRGQTQEKTGQESAAISKHIQEVKANPENEAAVVRLGKAYFDEGRFEEALKLFETASRLTPSDSAAYYEIGSSFIALKDYDSAIEALNRAVGLRPDYLEALGLLAFAYNLSGRYQDAIPVCMQALNLEPRNPDAYHGLGWAFGGLHRFRDAIEAYRAELDIRPYYAGAHYGLGVMYASLGALTWASKELGQAVEIDPYLAIAHSHLGLVYVAMRDNAAAQKELVALRPLDAELAAELEEVIRETQPLDSK
ncbi:MAG TPA: TonB family protein, partial [Blastocatellia bacterium]|nr:TonB family protein [Blastocatellia bacterium]